MGKSDGLPGSDEVMASARSLASAIDVGVTMDLDLVDPIATAAALAVSVPPEDIPVESMPPRSTTDCDSRLVGLVSLVAEEDDQVRDLLLHMFPSYGDLVGHAHLDVKEAVRTKALSMLQSFPVQNRFTAVLGFIERGGTWQDGLTLSDMHARPSAAAAATKSEHTPAPIAHHRKQDLPVPAAQPGPRIQGHTKWKILEGYLDGYQVKFDRADMTFPDGEREKILKMLEPKLGAQLNLNGPPYFRKSKGADTSGSKEAYFLLRCKGYSHHQCKFQVEVSATVLEEKRKYMCMLHISLRIPFIFQFDTWRDLRCDQSCSLMQRDF